MNIKNIIIGIVGILLVGGIVFFSSGSDLFQGRMFKNRPQSELITSTPGKKQVNVTLDSSSPSGNRSVASQDKIAVYKICAGKEDITTIEGMDLTFTSGSSKPIKYPFDVVVEETYGNKSFASAEKNTVSVTLKNASPIKAGECTSYSVMANTVSMDISNPGVDDPLTVTLRRITPNIEITSGPVISNTLLY
ncbi:hypothetical protein M0P48_04130 [Candidatus Gracilibacteria bacterium]|nr:hypothetical protein [Candidatus Gracilibacteria bacterium]